VTPAEEQLAFYFEIGNAITQWAHVEHSLGWVFATCFSDNDFSAAGMVFFAIENFRSKLAAVDHAMRAAHGTTPHYAEWEGVQDRLRATSAKRNALAHYPSLIYATGRPGLRYALIPRISRSKAKIPPKVPAGRLFVRDIVAIRYEFFALNITLQNLHSRLRGQSEEFPKANETPKPPPTIAKIRKWVLLPIASVSPSP
jgi:hypothetical protein